jgi:hypothetical protein
VGPRAVWTILLTVPGFEVPSLSLQKARQLGSSLLEYEMSCEVESSDGPRQEPSHWSGNPSSLRACGSWCLWHARSSALTCRGTSGPWDMEASPVSATL